MPPHAQFEQECPVCGRPVQIRVQHLGHWVTCQHCHGQFIAAGSRAHEDWFSPAGHPLVRRADQLLTRSANHAQPARQWIGF